MLIDGIHVPLPEPFYRDGELNLRKLEHNVRRYSLGPVNGLVALPPGGEASSLSDDEAVKALQTVGQRTAPHKVLIAGIQRDSVHSALMLASVAEAADFDALLLAPPGNWQALGPASNILLFFRTIADRAALPVLLWSSRAAGACELPIEMIADASRHRNIIGLCDAGLTVERFKAIQSATEHVRREVTVTSVFAPVTRRMLQKEDQGAATFVSAEALGSGAAFAVAPPRPVLKTRTKSVAFQIMAAGSTRDMLPLLESGVAGAMPWLAACAPQACYEVYAALKDGDPGLAMEKAARLQAADPLLAELGVAGLKYGCDLNGYFGGFPRLPRLPLQAGDRHRVESSMSELRN